MASAIASLALNCPVAFSGKSRFTQSLDFADISSENSPRKYLMEAEIRARIVTILYNDVVRAQQALTETKNTDLKAHREAQKALEDAVRRYTDFTLDGTIPEDIRLTDAAGSGQYSAS
jgi:hypothetical protein